MAAFPSADTAFPFISATDLGVGICGTSAGACSTDGLLIVNDELKTEFRGRDFIKGNPTGVKRIIVGKATGSSSSIYACFTPLSKSVRDKACTEGHVYTITLGTATRSVVASPTCVSTNAAWSTTPYYVCLPQ